MFKHLFAAVLCLLPALGSAEDRSRAILVLDASGSMWGQIDGKAKITIAQEVIGDLLQSLPAEQELGLTVYGHRRKGDCTDIETMILPGGDTRSAIMMAVSAITPKGKTPLSAAVIQAAEALKYTEERATVILVSDGRETCELDPCQVGRDLEKSGIDFTAHVIGFDISNAKDRAELQCLAEETGGTFRTASNATELNDALQVIAEPDPTPFTVTLRATEGADGPDITGQVAWELYNEAGTLVSEIPPQSTGVTFDKLPGSYRVEALRPADEENVTADFIVVDQNMTVTLVFPKLLPTANLTAPDTAIAGSAVKIGWDGPNGKSDHVTIAKIDSTAATYVAYSYTETGNPISLKMPLTAGEYQLRYIQGGSTEILARRKIIITPVSATLTPPSPITAGSVFALDWSGPDYPGDFISVSKQGSSAAKYETYSYTETGTPLQLAAPTTPGTYVLRYIAAGPDSMALATKEIDVIKVFATLESKDTVTAGDDIQVTWSGPNTKSDYIAINNIGDDLRGELAYAYTKNSTDNSVSLQLPTTPGTYELRYVQNGTPKALLASKIITVTPVSATLESKDTVSAGDKIKVTWMGPNTNNDYIAINEIGDDLRGELAYAYTKNSTGNSIDLKLPTTAGTYELRYIQNGKPKVMLASKTITVIPVSATVESKDTVSAGAQLLVTWSGPNTDSDYIALNEVGDDLRGELAYSYLKNGTGNSITLKLPTTPGTFELRYIQNGKPKTMLAMKTITITAVTASLDTNATPLSGARTLVRWTGPNTKNDYISITTPDSGIGHEKTYAYLSKSDGQAILVDVPGTPGTYEMRYIQGGSPKTILARQTLTVQAVQADLMAAPTIMAGADLLVEWTGPGYKSDRIAISLIGEKRLAQSVYTSDGSPLMVKAPKSAGDYELLYVMGQDGHVLARQPLTVK